MSLVIIATLTAGVAGAVKMVQSARLNNARSITVNSPVTKIPGLVAWYETSRKESFNSNEAHDDGQISAWYDVSPGSITKQKNTLTRTASSAVTYQLNGISKLPSVHFADAGTRRLSVSSFYQGTSSQNTIFIVLKPYIIVFGNACHMIDSGSGTYSSFSILPIGIHMYLGANADAVATNCCSVNESYIIAAYFNSSYSKSYVNDAVNKVGNINVNPGTNVLDGLTVGNNLDGGYPFTGLISEVIVYNRPLDLQERRNVMSYLSNKYNITVAGL